jgi:hypothetical protein
LCCIAGEGRGVPATGGRRGRRDNGLFAAQYAAVGDIDPRIGEHLLDVLAAGGIAAYLQPSTDLHPITRTASLPSRPTDRLFVDRDYVGTAKEYVQQVQAGPEQAGPEQAGAEQGGRDRSAPGQTSQRETDVDDAFRAIVAAYHQDIHPDEAPWPASEELTRREPPRVIPIVELGVAPQIKRTEPEEPRQADTAADEPGLLDALDTFGADLPDEELDDPDDPENTYTPPTPPPLPRLSGAVVMSVLGILFGLFLFVFTDLAPLDRDTTFLVAFGSIVAGFGTLIWRLRPGDDDDDDFDDGARV